LELTSALGDFDRAQFTGPIVDILEQMPMDGAEMGEIERSRWYALGDSIAHQATLSSIKLVRVGNAETIAKNVGAGIDVRIVVSAHFASASARACAKI
jgi:hypothetical protein